jgi:hypothetical protein
VSTGWLVLPLDSRGRAWLERDGIVAPTVDGRWPTLGELRAALTRYDVDYRNGPDSLDVEVRDRATGHWVTLWIKTAGGDDQPARLTFHKPIPELMLEILAVLAVRCGPFLVVDHGGDVPIVVESRAG